MEAEIGRIVLAKAGRDKSKYFVIVDIKDGYIYIADGKTRKIAKPKRKNAKHLQFTNKTIEMQNITDKKLKKDLAAVK